MPKHIEYAREKVILAAQTLFFQKGFRNVTMDDVAKSLQMSKRTLYELFTDKDELLIECYKYQTAKYRAHMEQIVEKEANVLKVVLESMAYLFAEATEIAPQFFIDVPRSSKLLAFVEAKRRENEDEVVAYLEKGKTQGLLRPEIDFRIFYRAVQRLDFTSFYAETAHTHDIKSLFRHTILAYLRGCATYEGVMIINEFEREAFENRG